MKKVVAFLGFSVSTMGITFMYFTTVLQGHQILRYAIYGIFIMIWIYSVAAILEEPNQGRKRRRR